MDGNQRKAFCTLCIPQHPKENMNLDLSPFYGLNDLGFSEAQLDIVRSEFATAICNYAFISCDNREFIDGLILAMPPESGLLYPRLVGVGSCRRTYVTSFGLVLKVTRTDPLEAEELEWRGGKEYLPTLGKNRCFSNYCEVFASSVLPNASPRIYGVALSFKRRPNVIVSEAARPLDFYYPEDTMGVLHEHLHISHIDGRLIVSDPRFSQQKPDPLDRQLFDFGALHEDGIWLGNLDLTVDQRFVVIDLGGSTPLDPQARAGMDVIAAYVVSGASGPDIGGEMSRVALEGYAAGRRRLHEQRSEHRNDAS